MDNIMDFTVLEKQMKKRHYEKIIVIQVNFVMCFI